MLLWWNKIQFTSFNKARHHNVRNHLSQAASLRNYIFNKLLISEMHPKLNSIRLFLIKMDSDANESAYFMPT